ncbi:hypothetical protein D3C84_851670 [compost metagenome]
MAIMPLGATWSEDSTSRSAATVQAPGQVAYRDFSLVWQKGLNLRWANGRPVQAMAAEGLGTPVDPKDNSDMAVNYRSEPLWYRFAKAPDAPFGHGGWGDIANAHMAYSNALVSGDPVTPVPCRWAAAAAPPSSSMATCTRRSRSCRRTPTPTAIRCGSPGSVRCASATTR